MISTEVEMTLRRNVVVTRLAIVFTRHLKLDTCKTEEATKERFYYFIQMAVSPPLRIIKSD